MGEYEPRDSRNVTEKRSNIPIEPEKTGPREDETRPSKKKPDSKGDKKF